VGPRSQGQLQKLYRGVLEITAAVVGDARRAVQRVRGRVNETGAAIVEEIERTVVLVRRVQAQIRARVFRGDTHYREKLLSLFEPETEAIRKGKASKPTEFGKLVKIQEAESQFVTDYEICPNDLGVKRVALPRASHTTKPMTRQRWFRRALRWRTGWEAKISVLKRRYGLRRSRYRGMSRIERCVGFGVIANDLWVLGSVGAR